WPASFENVIAVGALGPHGKAWFSNYGPWVDACAPGVDIVSCFFDLGDEAGDAEDFNGWACWSGTSFSGPIVAAAIAWEWMCRGGRERVSDKPTPTTSGRPGHAAAWLLDRPGHFRYPWLGTVVNPY
ncbi:MAG TPA: S8 family serine peptidase, partial [Ilumatobacter sp.]|nr:S8 family serine peptidase [Ilumatobacter sp.]